MKALWQWTQDMRAVGGEPLPGAHARLADLLMDLVRVTGELVGDDEAQRQLGEFGGVQRAASVVAARERVASEQVAALTREMKTLAGSPHESGAIDERDFVKQLEEIRPLTGELERAVFEFVSAAEERAHHEQMDALTTAARQVPGVSLRVTEDVIGPDGSSTIVRDEMITGPTDDSPQVIATSSPTEITHALGLDVGRVQEAADRVRVLRARRAHARLGMADSASVASVHRELQRWLLDAADRDTAISSVLPFLPDGLRDVQPGDLHTLRSSLVAGMLNGYDQAAPRAARGDQMMGSAQTVVLLEAFAVSSAVPYYLPLGHQAHHDGAAHGPWRLPNEEQMVLRDRPMDVAGLPVLSWMFTANDDGAVEEIGQVLVVEGDLGFAVHNVNLVDGPAAPFAHEVLHALTTREWTIPKKRKLPGRPGDKAWRAQLGRQADHERRSGSLARVRTLAATGGPER